jgi:Type II secretion system (T2SS), protein M subtype b
MTRPDTQRLWWEVRRALRGVGRTGLAGLAGIMLLFAGSSALIAQVDTQRAQLTRLDALSLTLRERAQRATGAFDEAELAPEEQLARFYGSFPDLAAVPDVLARIYRAAGAEGLSLEQGEYRIVSERSGSLLRYRITLPVRGPYPQVRRFLAAALREAPFVALDSVSFQREGIGEAIVEAQIRLTIYLGATS